MSVTDRAALVTTTILNLLAMFRGGAEFGFLREPIESLLRDEFAEERWQGVVDRTLPDP
jgi:hypothetical protein